jgi:hypothetical protein
MPLGIASKSAEQDGKKHPTLFVIPSEARNLSFFSWAERVEKFLAPLGTKKYPHNKIAR